MRANNARKAVRPPGRELYQNQKRLATWLRITAGDFPSLREESGNCYMLAAPRPYNYEA